jgi:peptidoglycan/LPS O-acetylase OafA/YrhL
MSRHGIGPKSSGTASLLGFDVVRLAAMACVALQHALSVCGIEPRPLLGHLNLGQLGVTVFCTLSGYFALRPSGEPSWRWLARRLGRVYVPYWITLGAIFTANQAVGYKPVSLGLVVSEVLGTGYFTHGDRLVGVHVWFISLILVCYGFAVVLRGRPWALFLAIVVAIALMPLAPAFLRHLVSFLAGAVLATASRTRGTAIGMALAGLAATLVVRGEFAYPTAGVLALLAARGIPGGSPRALAATSQATYEFFLVHGPIYLAISRVERSSWLGTLVVGTALAVVASWLLHRATAWARSLPGRFRPRPVVAHSLAAPRR